MLRATDGSHLVIQNSLALCCISHIECDGEHLPIFTVLVKPLERAGGAIGGTPRGRSGTCEWRDNCPTLS